jgi:hypothetical protein
MWVVIGSTEQVKIFIAGEDLSLKLNRRLRSNRVELLSLALGQIIVI